MSLRPPPPPQAVAATEATPPGMAPSGVVVPAQAPADTTVVPAPPPPPAAALTLFEANVLVAMLGGFWARKADGHPGPDLLSRGLLILNAIVQWERLKPAAGPPTAPTQEPRRKPGLPPTGPTPLGPNPRRNCREKVLESSPAFRRER